MKPKKSLLIILLAFVIFIIFTGQTSASIVTIAKDGQVLVNVLSESDTIELEIPRSEYLGVLNIAQKPSDPDSKVTLSKEGDDFELKVSTNSGEESLEVNRVKEDLIEIEERPDTDKITIGIFGDKFAIKQRGVTALTDYEINIDPKTTRFTLTTPTGLRYLSILPRQAVNTALQAKTINRITSSSNLLLKEEVGEELSYLVRGERVINIADVFEYKVDVDTKVSALTGEILEVDQPVWLKVLNFILV